MKRYRNFGGNSGIQAYESGPDFIRIEFNDGAVYLYTYEITGPGNIEKMKQLAATGRGLNTFINKNVHKDFAQKER